MIIMQIITEPPKLYSVWGWLWCPCRWHWVCCWTSVYPEYSFCPVCRRYHQVLAVSTTVWILSLLLTQCEWLSLPKLSALQTASILSVSGFVNTSLGTVSKPTSSSHLSPNFANRDISEWISMSVFQKMWLISLPLDIDSIFLSKEVWLNDYLWLWLNVCLERSVTQSS